MKESPAVLFLYRTLPGRMFLKLLVQPKVSRAAGRFLSSRASRFLTPRYIRRHKIDMRDIEIPRGGFSSFNAFFTRKKKDGLKAAAQKDASGCVQSPCEGFLSVVRLREGTVFDIKNTRFFLEDLLKDDALAARFWDGTALIFRLTPANYHRYCYPADGRVLRFRRISGKLHCVRPVALRTYPVFAQNTREYQVIQTERFGLMVQMEIGALLVGKIRNSRRAAEAGSVRAGQEKGYFEFGGSTIVLLFQKDAVSVCPELLRRRNGDREIPVKIGERVGC